MEANISWEARAVQKPFSEGVLAAQKAVLFIYLKNNNAA